MNPVPPVLPINTHSMTIRSKNGISNPNFDTKLPLTILILNLQPIRLHHSTLNGVKPWMKSFKLCKDNRHEF